MPLPPDLPLLWLCPLLDLGSILGSFLVLMKPRALRGFIVCVCCVVLKTEVLLCFVSICVVLPSQKLWALFGLELMMVGTCGEWRVVAKK